LCYLQQEKLLVTRGKTIMMDEHEAVKRTGHTINDYRYIYPRVSVKIMAQYWLVPVSFNKQNYFSVIQ